MLDRSYTLASDSGTSSNPAPLIEEPWMDSPGTYEITVRSSETSQKESRVIPNRGSGCYAIIVSVREDGVSIPMDSESSGC